MKGGNVKGETDRQRSPGFSEWLATVPKELTDDSLWKMRVYQLSLFVCDLGWADLSVLNRDRRTIPLSDQLLRALGSVSANIAEGYSRGTGKDRARFYEYALGSAGESRDWYYKVRSVLGQEVVMHRLGLLSEVIRLLLTSIPDQRARRIREPEPHYGDGSGDSLHPNGA